VRGAARRGGRATRGAGGVRAAATRGGRRPRRAGDPGRAARVGPTAHLGRSECVRACACVCVCVCRRKGGRRRRATVRQADCFAVGKGSDGARPARWGEPAYRVLAATRRSAARSESAAAVLCARAGQWPQRRTATGRVACSGRCPVPNPLEPAGQSATRVRRVRCAAGRTAQRGIACALLSDAVRAAEEARTCFIRDTMWGPSFFMQVACVRVR